MKSVIPLILFLSFAWVAVADGVSLTNYDSVVSLATNLTKDYTFTDPASGQSVTIAVAMMPFSASNGSPVFTLLDTYGPGGAPVHLGIDSAFGGGDGNWVDPFEGVNFTASLVSASDGVSSNSIQFSIPGLGIRPNGGATLTWTSSAGVNSFTTSSESLSTLDTRPVGLSGQVYSGQLRTTSTDQYQLSDLGSLAGQSILLEATFTATNVSSGDPQLTSWLTAHSGQYARVYTTTNNRASGSSVTIWTGQSLPVYSDITEVLSSSNWVYIQYPDLASYVMGPWLNPQGGQFMFWPTNQHGIARFSRHPAAQSGTKTITGTGYSGNWVNGMAIFNALDGKAWDGTNLVMGPHNKPTYDWHRNAPVGEAFNFDYALGHQNPAGVYHTHQNPIALRFQLGDHIDYNSSTKNYSESTNIAIRHSPIIGWSYDGYPIYGPYGYANPSNATSGVRRMVSGYVVRDGNNGTDKVSTNLSTIPAWYARFRQAHFGGSYSTTASIARPPVTSTYPVGTFAEDYSYLGDLINSSTGSPYQQGTDFDLDEYNGRWCVTPDYPAGTYAYFVTIDTNGNAIYPYTFGYEYYGVANGSNNIAVSEPVVTNFVGGANSALVLSSPAITNSAVTLVWSATEGGTYRVEASPDLSAWTTNAGNIAAVLNRGTNATEELATNQFFRVVRTALAPYDPN